MAESGSSSGCGCGVIVLGVILGVVVTAIIAFSELSPEEKDQALQHVAQNVAKKTEEWTRPPVGITFRAGILTQHVLQVHSTTGKRQLMCNLHYSHNNEKSCILFALPPNGTTEPDSIDWEVGDTGYVEVEGYNRKVYFEVLKDGKYRTKVE